MSKLRNIYKSLLTGILVFAAAVVFAQPDAWNRAYSLVRENPVLAAQIIDSVIVHPETKDSASSWTVRAFIYFELYKRNDQIADKRYRLHSPLRDTVVSSLKKSNKLHPDEIYAEYNRTLLVAISAHCFNTAKDLLQDSMNHQRSETAYNKFKEIKKTALPQHNFKQDDINYYLAVGSMYSEMFTKDQKNIKAKETAKVALMKVLELEPEHPSANINLGLMYYNEAANLSREMDYGADISQIDIVQENMIKLAKQAEPFVLKVYNRNNNNEKALIGLYYIYRMLNDVPKSDDFKAKLKQKGVEVDDENVPVEDNKGEKKEEPNHKNHK
ncbi:MAG: hypothetical protein KF900_01090 [Bacteroidetes bacterium]|nr:hypothetical protein [Bacteroidota bacterium]